MLVGLYRRGPQDLWPVFETNYNMIALKKNKSKLKVVILASVRVILCLSNHGFYVIDDYYRKEFTKRKKKMSTTLKMYTYSKLSILLLFFVSMVFR